MAENVIERTAPQSEPDNEVLAALVRLARELPDVNADEALRRLAGMSGEQLAQIEQALRLVDARGRYEGSGGIVPITVVATSEISEETIRGLAGGRTFLAALPAIRDLELETREAIGDAIVGAYSAGRTRGLASR